MASGKNNNSGIDIVDMILNRPARFQRLTSAEKEAAEERMMSYLCNSDDEQGCSDDDDDYVPEDAAYDYASDAESEVVDVEPAEEFSDDEQDEIAEGGGNEMVAAGNAERVAGECYPSKAGVMWILQPPHTGRPLAHNIPVPTRTGPARHFLPNPINIFKEIFTPEMVNVIVRETNRKAQEVYHAFNMKYATRQRSEWEPTNEKEMYAFFGLLLFAGVFKCATQPIKELWAPYHHDIYKATMSIKRFTLLLRFIRFDNANTRPIRQELSKSAAIDDLWLMLVTNLGSSYTPSANLTVDEQLFPYRGRTRFTQYIPSKPAKYGMKIWWICDAKTNYPLRGQIYTGKSPDGIREVNQGERVVLDLARKYFYTGRTVYCDNFFTTLTLAQNLMEVRLALVGTVRSNKTFVPSSFKKSNKRQIYETLFGYYEDKYALCSYVPKKNKAVILLSTEHYTNDIVPNITADDEQGRASRPNIAKKPNQILDYNNNKAGVDTMDQMVSYYSCKRGTNRWPLAMFYNMLDISGLAAFVIHKEMVTVKQTDRRRRFLVELAKQLVIPHMEVRASNPRVLRFPHIRNAMAKFNVHVSITFTFLLL